MNGANSREHWSARAKRAKAQRAAAYARCIEFAHARAFGYRLRPGKRPGVAFPLPLLVTIVRVGPRLLDDDGLAIAGKALRDGIADGLGVDDGPASGVTWRYEQRKGRQATRNPPRPAEYGVEVVIAPAARQSAPGASGAVHDRPANESAPERPQRPGKQHRRRKAAAGGATE